MEDALNESCPFCGHKARVAPAGVVRLPEQLHEVLCLKCGHFHILSSLVKSSGEPSEKLKALKPDTLKLEAVVDANKKTFHEGMTALWIADVNNLVKWQDTVDDLGREDGYVRHKVYAIPHYYKSALG